MIEKQIVIKDSVGFHARTASLFAKKAAWFESDVAIVFNGKKSKRKKYTFIDDPWCKKPR